MSTEATQQSSQALAELRGSLEELVEEVFPAELVSEIISAPDLEFDNFAVLAKELGEPRCDGAGGVKKKAKGGCYPSSDEKHGVSEPSIAALCLRYPFLLATDDNGEFIWTDADAFFPQKNTIEQPPFSSSSLSHISWGWRARFGLEFCEDVLLIISTSSEYGQVRESRFLSCKNKLGTFRSYFDVPKDVVAAARLLALLYQKLSEMVCETCGSIEDVRMTTDGFITPLCDDHMQQRICVSGEICYELFGQEYNALSDGQKRIARFASYEQMTGCACLDKSKFECFDGYIPENKYVYASCGYNSRFLDPTDYPVNFDDTQIKPLLEYVLDFQISKREDFLVSVLDQGFSDEVIYNIARYYIANGGRARRLLSYRF